MPAVQHKQFIEEKLAINGGPPLRRNRLPYGRQTLDEDDIAAVSQVLRSEWLTTGPAVEEFERAFAERVGARHAVAVSSGTAALHAAMFAIGIGPGDEVIVPAVTFAATANCVVFQRGTPVFADVNADTLLLDPGDVEKKITSRTRAIIAVDYAGQPCDYDTLRTLAERHHLVLIDDASHSLGGSLDGRPVGTLADLNTFSFHPVKNITSGEGGMITTANGRMAAAMRTFRNHGITSNHRQRNRQGTFFYEMTELGFNYRITDIQCALGISQLHKLSKFIARRRELAAQYDSALADLNEIHPLRFRSGVAHAYHLYAVQLDLARLDATRDQIFHALQAEGIGVNVHYLPVHLHPFYRHAFGMAEGLCPVSEHAYERLLTLPLFPNMSDDDVRDVSDALHKVINHYRN